MDIYYALWAQMSNWTINQRAILVLGIVCLVFAVFLKLIGFRLAALFLWILNWLLKAVFICLSTLFSIRAYGAGAKRWNRISGGFEKVSVFLVRWKKAALQPHKKIAGKILILYCLLLICVVVPGWLGKVMDTEYVEKVSGIRNLYMKCEQIPLEKAKAYAPLIDPAETPVQSERILKLSERGVPGANIRTEPNPDSGKITVIWGDAQMTYIREQDGWIYVRLSDGTEGWIRDYLVQDAG